MSLADGLNAPFAGTHALAVVRERVDELVLVTEAELEEGVRLALRATQNLAEGAGAAALIAAVKMREALQGRTVVCVMSGGNLSMSALQRIVGAVSDSV